MKIIKVEKCANCPYVWGIDFCSIEDMDVGDSQTIPKWCPLEDYNANNTR